MARVSVEHRFTGTTGPIDSLSAPTVSVTNIGVTGATTYGYRVSAINSVGETLASSTVTTTTGNAALTGSNFNRISWTRVLGATGYKVYGRTASSELLMATLTTANHYDDTGAVSPSGALPSTNTTGYSSTRTSIGTLMKQQTGSADIDKWIGPMPVGISRPMEGSTAIPGIMPHVIRWSTDIDWLFLVDNAAATTSRRIIFYVYNRATNVLAWEGFITVTHPSLTNATVRGFKMTYDTYTTGTASASGTSVTGSGTAWSANRIAVGSRIGFGSTDPNFITRWYEISAIGSDTGITLAAAVDATVAANTPYVIEELRAVMAQTNSTAASGGLFVAKGLRPELFITSGTTIAAATTTDSQRACYWLADAASVLNQTSLGLALQAKTSYTDQNVYVLDGTTSCRVYVYNIRAALSGLASGKSTSAIRYWTGTQTLTGTASQVNNARLATLNHGPGAGVECLYFSTTTRIYRARLTDIVNLSTVWVADCMVEIPPGSTNTTASASVMNTPDYIDNLDRLIISSTGGTASRHYVTRYQTNVEQFDLIWGVDTRQLDSTLADVNAPILPGNILATPFTFWTESGLTYIARVGAATTSNHVYVVPFGAHWGLQTNQRVITPEISTPNCVSYHRACMSFVRKVGADKFSVSPESIKMYYRTNGITDNTGTWYELDDYASLSGVAPSSSIQFMFEFKTIGTFCLPGRLLDCEVMYETEDTLPSHLQWNFADSNNSNGTIGFIQKSTYGSVPNLQIDYYRADNDINLLTQASTGTTNGTFEYWTGAAWAAGLGSDAVGQRRRFVPSAGLPASTNVYAKIQVI
jgi:hypothetical protein